MFARVPDRCFAKQSTGHPLTIRHRHTRVGLNSNSLIDSATLRMAMLWLFLICSCVARGEDNITETLARIPAIEWPEADLSARMMDGAHRFVERKIAESLPARAALWERDFSSTDAYNESILPHRERFQTLIGAVDPRLPPNMERYGDDQHPALVGETTHYQVFQVRWPVLECLSGSALRGHGLLVQPKLPPRAHIIWIPDADQTPEQLLGLAPGAESTSAALRRFAESGCEIVVPETIRRDKYRLPGDERLRVSDQTFREWIYRQAFHMGRHVIGYEVQTVRAAVDWIRAKRGNAARIGVAGYVEGGLVAFYSAAVDTRIDSTLVSGYFDSREQVWAEPIYRNVWGLLREFGDAEIVSLIAPRKLIVEHSRIPEIQGHKGQVRQPELARIRTELGRVETCEAYPKPQLILAQDDETVNAYSETAIQQFAESLGIDKLVLEPEAAPADRRHEFDPAVRHQRYFQEMQGHVQMLLHRSEQVREKAFLLKVMPEFADARWSTNKQHPTTSADKFIAGAVAFREQFRVDGMGAFNEPLSPFHVRMRRVAEHPQWTAYDVVLDVWPELFAWGILVLPNDLKPGERRPVVVCQHGRNGVPRDTLDANQPAYNNFSAALAERGFITFAPHNLYRGEDRYRWLSRKANTVQASLFSFIIAQHDQILRWLSTLPCVDQERIAFYGLSYGGETAVRVPTILQKYCLSICSGDFNQWSTKIAAIDQPFSFMRTIEWEMPYWNLGQTFDYAEMASLMIPRPFMVERGHLDLVGRDQWVAHEYAKVRWLYAQLGLADRTEIEFFQGGHSIHGEGTFRFLHKHLRWPEPENER